MKPIKLVDPFRCCMWALHDRLEGHITEESCRTEIASFLKHGQLVPVLGRPLRSDPLHDVELIYGARRLFVARHLNKQLAVELRDIADREALAAMDIENRQRQDISAYERGMSYARWLRGGYFDSQEDISRALKISPSQVSRLLRMAKLPSLIVNAFGCAADICERWGLDLADIWENPLHKQAIARQARAIAAVSPRPPACDVYRKLLSSAVHGHRPAKRERDEVVLDDSGSPLYRIRRQRKSIAIVVPIAKVSARCLERLRTAVTCVLNDGSAQLPDTRTKKSTRLLRADAMHSFAGPSTGR